MARHGTRVDDGVVPVTLAPRPVAASVDELLDGARRLGRPHARRRPVVRRVRAGRGRRRAVPREVRATPTRDFTMRVSGDIGCRPRRVWAAGLMDVVPERIDHATLGRRPLGPHGWGAALLMRDVGPQLVPVGDEPVTEAAHLGFLDGIAALSPGHVGLDRRPRAAPAPLPLGVLRRRRRSTVRPRSASPRPSPASPPRAGTASPRGRRPTCATRSAPSGSTRPRCPRRSSTRRRRSSTATGSSATSAPGPTDGWCCSTGPTRAGAPWPTSWPGTWRSTRPGFPPGTRRSRPSPTSGPPSSATASTPTAGGTASSSCACSARLVQFGWEKAYGDDDELGWWVDRAREGLRAAVTSPRSCMIVGWTRT